jgi:hypothetical protein
MKKLVVLLLVSLMATTAFAQIDPDPDGIGVYFDMAATQVSYDATVNVPFFAYVCITNPTAAEVHGLEFGYQVNVPAGLDGLFFRLLQTVPAGAVDLGNSTNKLMGDFVVGLASPLPAAASVPFVTWQFMLLTPMSVEFYITGSTVPSLPGGEPAYEIGGSIRKLQQSTGGDGFPVATINGPAPVAVEETSFGSVKSLFR